VKVLFFTSPTEDYLADSLLHGLKSLFGSDVVDFPRCELLYQHSTEPPLASIYGKGFTLYSGLLEDLPVNRFRILERIQNDCFDLVVISNIWRQFGWFAQLRPWLKPGKTVILDGADSPQTYPAAGVWWRRPYYWFLPRAHRQYLYFKREWTGDTQFNLWHRLVPRSWRRCLPQARNLRPISFSIPEEKMVTQLPEKKKLWPRHIVDPEVAARVPESRTSYAFSTEAEYYADLQNSKFGITTKRSGWDCLRHYEIAANGAVPCFRDLALKPQTCAPHGLQPNVNCLAYYKADDLCDQVGKMDPAHYRQLQEGALTWARDNSTKVAASRLLGACHLHWS
jgi:hypothetical protein